MQTPSTQQPATQAFQAILERATDLGVPDLAEQHDHYLYGGAKPGPPSESLLAGEPEHLQAQLDAVQADLVEFEGQYGMTSDDFYRRYRAGQTDDRMDFVEWASLVQMANHLRERLRVLDTSQPELPSVEAPGAQRS
jgi:hypothetical protein